MTLAEDGLPAVTRDAFYGGRLILTQPVKGHRSGTDAVLLAAAVPRDFAGLCYDIGSGVGAAGLGVALACPEARVRLVERDPVAARLARDNIAANSLAGRCDVVQCDVVERRQSPLAADADLVVTNPPFWEAHEVRASPDPDRSAAHVFPPGVTMADWLTASLDLLAAKGTLIVIHAPSAVPESLVTLGRRLGGLTLMGIHASPSAPAKRILLRGTSGSRAPLSLAAPLFLHEGGRFALDTERLHRGEANLSW